MKIDLRSDTITLPTQGMLDAMYAAEVGDDVFEEDPTVNQLEKKAAKMFGKEAGLFCPSGTMTNQIAIKALSVPGDEVICDKTAHVYNYEGGGVAFNSGCSVRLLNGDRGRFLASEVDENINPNNVHHPVSRVVVVENTSNKGGGSIWDFNEIGRIKQVCKQNNLFLHLDGARLFNAIVETGITAKDFGKTFDTISICLSKGLGAPVGSLLLGSTGLIRKARRIRKVMGGGMRQAGYLAAAGIYALDHHIQRLRDDHARARHLAETIKKLPVVREVLPVETNIIVFTLKNGIKDDEFLRKLADKSIIAVPFGRQTIRMVTHLNFNDDKLERTNDILKSLFD